MTVLGIMSDMLSVYRSRVGQEIQAAHRWVNGCGFSQVIVVQPFTLSLAPIHDADLASFFQVRT